MHDSSLKTGSDVYRTITDRIILAIEAGAGEFVMPWHRSGPGLGRPTNAASGNRYRGTNVVALWAEATLAGYESGHWATYRQWQSLGAQVRRGEHGAVIVFYKALDAEDDDDEEQPGRRLIARASRVFNADQVDGWERPNVLRPSLAEVLPQAEAFVQATGAVIRHGTNHACYRPKEDLIEVPDRDRFLGSPTSSATEAYYSTVLHELTHWTGAVHRLNRTFGVRFGDASYAAEELVAELGAAFLCADLGIANEPRADHAAYVAVWLEILGVVPKTIFTAAREASLAVDHLNEAARWPETEVA